MAKKKKQRTVKVSGRDVKLAVSTFRKFGGMLSRVNENALVVRRDRAIEVRAGIGRLGIKDLLGILISIHDGFELKPIIETGGALEVSAVDGGRILGRVPIPTISPMALKGEFEFIPRGELDLDIDRLNRGFDGFLTMVRERRGGLASSTAMELGRVDRVDDLVGSFDKAMLPGIKIVGVFTMLEKAAQIVDF